MAKKGKDGITEKHFKSFSEVVGAQSSLSVYGSIIKNAVVQPGTRGILHPSGVDESLQLAQVVGYAELGRCIQLGEPQLIAMPTPDGPADGCGWDPVEYVVWKNLPNNWTTLHLKVSATGLHTALQLGVLGGADDTQLRADQIQTILRDCIPLAGGNRNPIDLSETLQYYGLDKDGVIAFAGLVTGSADYGVKRYQFELPGSALSNITVTSKLGDIANTIQDKAVHA
jgi:hypothetical protein